jgi:hypothetical protein
LIPSGIERNLVALCALEDARLNCKTGGPPVKKTDLRIVGVPEKVAVRNESNKNLGMVDTVPAGTVHN